MIGPEIKITPLFDKTAQSIYLKKIFKFFFILISFGILLIIISFIINIKYFLIFGVAWITLMLSLIIYSLYFKNMKSMKGPYLLNGEKITINYYSGQTYDIYYHNIKNIEKISPSYKVSLYSKLDYILKNRGIIVPGQFYHNQFLLYLKEYIRPEGKGMSFQIQMILLGDDRNESLFNNISLKINNNRQEKSLDIMAEKERIRI